MKMLFAQSIRVLRRGRYHVTVLERGTPLRFATVDGTGEPVHPWLTLQESPRPLGPLDNVPGGEGAFLGRFVPCGGEVMIPYWPGYYPFPEAGTQAGLTDPTLPLPRLMPDAPAVIDLRNDGFSLIAISAQEIIPNPTRFVARWWINGKPHVPTEVRNTIRDGGRAGRIDANTFRLELDFDVPGLECRSGDRITLQLLYFYGEWSAFGRKEQRVWPSNRIELTVP
jgi:hypothetical protein